MRTSNVKTPEYNKMKNSINQHDIEKMQTIENIMRHQATNHQDILDVTEQINHLVKVLNSNMERTEQLATELRPFIDHKLKQPSAMTEFSCSTCGDEINYRKWKLSKMCVSCYENNRNIERMTKRRETEIHEFTNNRHIGSSTKI